MSDGVTATPAGLSMEVDIDKPTIQPGAPPPETGQKFLESIPETYRSKEWAVNFAKTADPFGEMAKSYENQMGVIGRKAEGLRVPGEAATETDWKEFYKQIGVPETPDKYEYKAPAVPENLKAYFHQDDELLKTMKDAAIKAGVRPEGFKHLAEVFDNYYLASLEKHVTSMNETLSKLETGFKTKFGERSNQVLENWKASQAALSPEQKAALDALDPQIKVILADQYEGFAKKYVREDKLLLDVPNTSTGMTATEYGEEYEKAFAKVRYAPNPSEKLKAEAELNNLRKRGEEIFKK